MSQRYRLLKVISLGNIVERLKAIQFTRGWRTPSSAKTPPSLPTIFLVLLPFFKVQPFIDEQKVSYQLDMTLLVSVLDAAIVGLGGAMFMTLFEFVFWKKWGMSGVAEWQVNWVMISKLTRRLNGNQESKISWTIASHLSHGVVASVFFSLLLSLIFSLLPGAKVSILLDAVVYSVVLWVIFSVLLRKTFESAGGIRISDRGLLVSLLSHFVYGIFLGLFLSVA